MKVKEVMSRPIITEDENSSVLKVAEILNAFGIGSVVITQKGEPSGIITERDIVTKIILRDKKPSEFHAEEIMSFPLITIDHNADISEASKLMVKKHIRRLPVVEKGSLVGIISIRNILSEKPECVKKIYPKTHALISALVLEKIEDSLINTQQLLPNSDEENFENYYQALEDVYNELGQHVKKYEGDDEIEHIFKDLSKLHNKKDLSSEEQKEQLSEILKDLRHVILWRKLRTPSGLSYGQLPFSDFRKGISSISKLPK